MDSANLTAVVGRAHHALGDVPGDLHGLGNLTVVTCGEGVKRLDPVTAAILVQAQAFRLAQLAGQHGLPFAPRCGGQPVDRRAQGVEMEGRDVLVLIAQAVQELVAGPNYIPGGCRTSVAKLLLNAFSSFGPWNCSVAGTMGRG